MAEPKIYLGMFPEHSPWMEPGDWLAFLGGVMFGYILVLSNLTLWLTPVVIGAYWAVIHHLHEADK